MAIEERASVGTAEDRDDTFKTGRKPRLSELRRQPPLKSKVPSPKPKVEASESPMSIVTGGKGGLGGSRGRASG